jgi:type IV/VI secretion system ImpK/VasF family protein
VLEFLTNFTRRLSGGSAPAGEEVRYEALSALRDGEDVARNDPVAERVWNDRVQAMLVYLLDYTMMNNSWPGRNYWANNQLETDPQVLDHPQALGGERFFQDCDEVQREYELAERRDRRDKDELAETLSLYFVCLRLGFKGQYHDRPQQLADYSRRLFTRLPAYANTRAKEMFPETYRHNQVVKVNYNLGTSLAVVLIVFAVILTTTGFAFNEGWRSAVKVINDKANKWSNLDRPQAQTEIDEEVTLQGISQ